MNNILIGGAWPYANGSLHIGHIAALLPGDVLARYWRAKEKNVFYVSGSDCYGTPITIRAKQEGSTPFEISEYYHKEFCQVFEKLGFSYDLYTKTSDINHIEFVTKFHKKLYDSDYVKIRTVNGAYCPECNKILADRLVTGKCPSCGEQTRGDQCDSCGDIFDINVIVDPKCADCNNSLIFKDTTQLFLLISKLDNQLRKFLDDHPVWRKNAKTFTKRYIDDGLRDRAITRDLDWGIEVPKEGFEDKKIYIWAENVLGYLSASFQLCQNRGIDFNELFGENSRHYYIHGKDNIPFHTIILPSLLLAHGDNLHLPDDIVSSEHVTLEGKKISTSKNWAVWADELADKYNPDTIRYFFIANGPEKRDSDFSWHEFYERNNSELVGIWGNFVNRTLAFIAKYLDNKIPNGDLDDEITNITEQAFLSVGKKIENACFRDALFEIFDLIRFGNKYYDFNQPWKTRTNSPSDCIDTIYNCTFLIANIAVLLLPFLPFSSSKLIDWLKINTKWEPQKLNNGIDLPELSILFDRIND